MKTVVKVYRNKRNNNKYIEVHNDGHYHNSVRQYIEHNQKVAGRRLELCGTTLVMDRYIGGENAI
jgi:hypothetical protein